MQERKASMRIYFAGSIRAGQDDAAMYEAMIAGSPGIRTALCSGILEAETIMEAFVREIGDR